MKKEALAVKYIFMCNNTLQYTGSTMMSGLEAKSHVFNYYHLQRIFKHNTYGTSQQLVDVGRCHKACVLALTQTGFK